MSPLEDRFRIPGGSLDLDLDDDHENATEQVAQSSSPKPPIFISGPPQQIAHLNPAELSRILSYIPHRLAPMTADYVLALNLSGTALRNLDISALNVLANHDTEMAGQLVRIQEGVLPCVLPLAGPSPNHSYKKDSDILSTAGNDLPDSGPPAAAHSTSSAAAPLSPDVHPGRSSPSRSPHSETGKPPPSPSREEKAGDDTDESILPLTDAKSRAEDAEEGTTSGTHQNMEDSSSTAASLPLPSDSDINRRGGAATMASAADAESSPSHYTSAASEETRILTPPVTSAEEQAAAPAEEITTGLIHGRPSNPQLAVSEEPLTRARESSLAPSAPPTPPVTDTSETVRIAERRSPATRRSSPASSSPYTNPPPDNVDLASTADGTFSEAQTSPADHCHATADSKALTAPAQDGVDPAQNRSKPARTCPEEPGETGVHGDSGAPHAEVVDAHGGSAHDSPDGSKPAAHAPPDRTAPSLQAALGDGGRGDVLLVDAENASTEALPSDGGKAAAHAQPNSTAPPEEGGLGSVLLVDTGSASACEHDNDALTLGHSDGPGCGAQGTMNSASTGDSASQSTSNEGSPNSEAGERTRTTLTAPTSSSTTFTTSFASSGTDTDTLASRLTPASTILETPSAPSVSRRQNADDSSFLDFDLLQFSPISFDAHLVHDSQISLSGELFKGGIGTDAPDALLMADSACEGQLESDIEPTTKPNVQSSCPNLASIAQECSDGFNTATYTTTSPDTTANLGGEWVLHKNSHDGNGDGTPAKYGHNQPNHPAGRHDSRFRGSETDEDVGNRGKNTTCTGLVSPAHSRGFTHIDHMPSDTKRPLSPTFASANGLMAPSRHDVSTSNSSDFRTPLPVEEHSPNRDPNFVGEKYVPQPELRPPLLGLSIPISPTSLEDELSELSPLFSPIASNDRSAPNDSASSQVFPERFFPVPRASLKTPVKSKRGARMPVARHSRGTETKRNLADASAQTDEDVEVESLCRRVKALERELRTLRAVARRSEERVQESKPRSFWEKVASTDRVVPPREPVKFGLLKDISWNFSSVGQDNCGTATSP
ncbi:hypothetical protein DFH07DRAFT_779909 [Mycena maculata]|uniref:Uncharacterized protein n=1 Tax=Mycena maculata TaxID=230809 RepID=A0AAD7I773_9AGAR|nr:hypothetical protein DFH07DRAFT_779909 [Mycena maculata]